MRAVINFGNVVMDAAIALKVVELLGEIEQQDYEWLNNSSVYYVKPLPGEGIQMRLLPDDVYETQKLAWKLKQEAKENS